MLPRPGDYIDIHNHGGIHAPGIFTVENLMMHEGRFPVDAEGIVYSAGLHPWFIEERSMQEQLEAVRGLADANALVAIGEAGFDRLRGASPDLQRRAFEAQVAISEDRGMPLFIHCVRAWDELLEVHRKLKPEQAWIVHGFRGKIELARQLLARNMYISFWFEFVMRSGSAPLLRALPLERIFLETDGSGVPLRDIYFKVAADLECSAEELAAITRANYINVFKPLADNE